MNYGQQFSWLSTLPIVDDAPKWRSGSETFSIGNIHNLNWCKPVRTTLPYIDVERAIFQLIVVHLPPDISLLNDLISALINSHQRPAAVFAQNQHYWSGDRFSMAGTFGLVYLGFRWSHLALWLSTACAMRSFFFLWECRISGGLPRPWYLIRKWQVWHNVTCMWPFVVSELFRAHSLLNL